MIVYPRIQGWQSAYNQTMIEAQGREFKQGTHDCLLWSAEMAFALTEDPRLGKIIEALRGAYEDNKGAIKIMKSRGYRTLEDAIGHFLPKIPVEDMRVGDVAVFWERGYKVAGISRGHNIAAVSDRGITKVALDRTKSAYGVGHG